MAGIDVLPAGEALQIVDSVVDVLVAEFAIKRLRGGGSATLSSAQWRIAGEMGWLGLSLASDCGGVGYSIAEEVLAHREFGRALLSPSVAATAIVGHMLGRDQSHAAAPFIEGSQNAAFAVTRGEGCLLIDAAGASQIVLLSGAGLTLFDRAAAGGATEIESIDGTLLMQRAETPEGGGRIGVRADLLHVCLLLTAQLSGIADATCAMATAYAKLREQFGKPIGSFQAISHACADAGMRAKAADAQVIFAAIALRDGRPDAAYQVAAACRVAADAAFRNATMNIHTHGGVGYSAELEAHLYLKRTIVIRQLVSGLASDRDLLLGQGPAIQ